MQDCSGILQIGLHITMYGTAQMQLHTRELKIVTRE